MNKRWQQMNDWFQQQPRDRRILIATLLWVVIAVYLVSVLIMPEIKTMNTASQRTAQLQQQVTQAEALNEQLQRQLQHDVNQPLREDITSKQKRLQQLVEQASGHSVLGVAQRKQFLREALNYPDSMQLISLNTPQPERITDEDSGALYQHRVDAVLRGDFATIKRYAEQLQTAFPEVEWLRFNYQVDTYPQAQLTIAWRIISMDKEFIGAN
ncbi:hypothetical protein [Idiomarina sp. UBA3162]|uniref:hypothetical protein n=1 Tax=Idiomarina sp. UBA3162 TaxID=1946641 RepID=UPI000C93D8F7|nr:hypothetical protein [Idiomarina sp. UBA3162]MAD52678.1 hypothetical protein [Idiomarinaceae bacterium]|tara:strand:+ start:2678 stop:3313 length:636 start_codon:yes stop_codon:yes gene_type:complete